MPPLAPPVPSLGTFRPSALPTLKRGPVTPVGQRRAERDLAVLILEECTVRSHVYDLLSQFRASTRAGLVYAAVRRGVLVLDGERLVVAGAAGAR